MLNNKGTNTALKAVNTRLLRKLHLNRDMFSSNSFLRDIPPPPVAPVHYNAEIDFNDEYTRAIDANLQLNMKVLLQRESHLLMN